MELIASILLCDMIEVQHGESIPFPRGKGIIGELLWEGVGE